MATLTRDELEAQLALAAMYNAIRAGNDILRANDTEEFWVLPYIKAHELTQMFPDPPQMHGRFWERVETDPKLKATVEFIKTHAIRRNEP